MKTAAEWLKETEPKQHGDYADLDLELPPMVRSEFRKLVEAIQADARAEGRREGLLEATRVLDDYFHSGHDCPYCHRGDAVAGAQSDIRKLIEAEKGGGW